MLIRILILLLPLLFISAGIGGKKQRPPNSPAPVSTPDPNETTPPGSTLPPTKNPSDDLGKPTTSIPTPVLLPGLAALGAQVVRKRRAEAAAIADPDLTK